MVTEGPVTGPRWPDPAKPDTCRRMETRQCPPVYGDRGCADRPCARYESDDPAPWLAGSPTPPITPV